MRFVISLIAGLALVTFFGALAGNLSGKESKGMARGLIAASLLILPIRVVVDLLQGDAVAWRHELLLFSYVAILVVAFLLNRALALRIRAGSPPPG